MNLFQDRHGADGNGLPPLDEEQNIESLGGMEDGGWTMIKYRRQRAACEDNDLPITVSILFDSKTR